MSALQATIEAIMRPHRNRLNNLIGRAVVSLVNNAAKTQALQIGVLAGETLDNAEHLIPYGLISVPRANAQGVVLFPGGDRAHPIVVAVDDPSARPTGGDPGDTGLYHFAGATMRLNKDGDVVISAAPGRKVYIDDGAGGTAPVATLSDVQGVRDALHRHEHLYIPYPSGVAGTPVPTTNGPVVPAPSGTEVLESK